MTLLFNKPDLGSNCTGESKMENETAKNPCLINILHHVSVHPRAMHYQYTMPNISDLTKS